MKFSDLYSCEEYDVPPAAMDRLKSLYLKLRRLESASGIQLSIIRGFETWAEFKEANRAFNDKRLIVGLKELPIVIGSSFRTGDGAELEDLHQSLKVWIGQNVPVIEEIGLYFQSFHYTPHSVRCQQVPPKTGKRFFRDF